MKYLYQGVVDVLLNDADLKDLVGYTNTKKNIRRGYQPEGKWDKLVVFYLQTSYPKTDFNSQIREIPLIVRVYDRDDDLNVDDIAERLVLLLDGADLSIADKVYVYDCSFGGVLISTNYNEELKSYEKVLRFIIITRQEEKVGNSGAYPTRKRKRSWT